ncbi:TetR family transcriptional regulator [Izhakiella australiensis]|uniref:TetR family transcriptional regulator n=1 Tax=Izhakiella australiensis TaxID=1926881 RepID=A0A1S8YI23_9GAMM|nr:TetR/AcrR family transcriptional regulator [Izhakiella australiensis]OON38721.1 TetR family transcriptional regulator [Izhakiella australiensis]
MKTYDMLLNAALKLLEEKGEAQFTTRNVCAIANITAPSLYHHFGSVDGLLSAAIEQAFSQFLASKQAAVQSDDPATALREGWDDYVRFAAARPRLYAAMMSRVLDGAEIPAASQAYSLLLSRISAMQNRLAPSVDDVASIIWASANAASLLYVTAQLRNTGAPSTEVIAQIRENAFRTILNSEAGAQP